MRQGSGLLEKIPWSDLFFETAVGCLLVDDDDHLSLSLVLCAAVGRIVFATTHTTQQPTTEDSATILIHTVVERRGENDENIALLLGDDS